MFVVFISRKRNEEIKDLKISFISCVCPINLSMAKVGKKQINIDGNDVTEIIRAYWYFSLKEKLIILYLFHLYFIPSIS